MELLAAEPLVTSPVAGAYDEDGRLYVVEMSDYPHVDPKNDKPFAENRSDPPIGRVRLLIDHDGDGRFDEGHIFADKLSWPTGIAVWKGGVYVAATPDIWYLRDNDGDHKADERRRVFTGFRKYNVQAVMNNLEWGPDHRIYGAGSSNGGKVHPADREGDAVDILRRDFRFDPSSDRFEAISGGARFGNTFDDWGNRFICDIRNPAQHVVLPARYLARNPDLPIPRAINDSAEFGDTIRLFRISPPEPWRELRARRWAAVGKVMPRSELVGAGFLTSSSGITAYRGDAYPPAYRRNLFLGEVANNLIHRMAVTPDGVTFRARRADANAEFLASTDTWFRPVNFVNAPDGTFHVFDMYRETIEHPWSIPDDIRNRLDLRSGSDRGRVYRLTPPSFRHRPTPRLSRATTDELVGLLEHPNAWHAETAHRLLFERQDPAAIPLLRRLVRESKEERGRFLALYSLAGSNAFLDGDLLVALADASPHVREHAVLLAEPWLKGSPALRTAVLRMADDPDVRVRFQVAFSVGALAGKEPAQALAKIASRDAADPWIRAAILSSATNDPAGLFADLYRTDFRAKESGPALLQPLLFVIGARAKRDELARVIEAFNFDVPLERPELLISLGEGLARSQRTLKDLVGIVPGRGWLDAVLPRAAERAGAEDGPPSRRAQYMTLVGLTDYALASQAFGGLLEKPQPAEVQAAIVRAYARFNRPEVAEILLKPWSNYSPSLRAEVVGILLGRSAWAGPVLSAVKAGKVPVAMIPATRRAILLNDRSPAIRALAQEVLGGLAAGPRAEAVARYKPSIERAGDSGRGRTVFDRECQVCHKLGERGHAVGPNLAGIRNRTADEILVNVLDPNREVSPEFLEYTVALDDGRIVTGLVTAETPNSVTLRGREGVEQTILRKNIEEIHSTGKSLMPEGLEKTVTPAEMGDLIAFLLKIQD
ncbi:MAG: c-type cytochrome [Isosphaeraceae bacterium]|nr:c-type cytochrome [Isosphaeraceae bacterium]